jgi:hypothetical protein
LLAGSGCDNAASGDAGGLDAARELEEAEDATEDEEESWPATASLV